MLTLDATEKGYTGPCEAGMTQALRHGWESALGTYEQAPPDESPTWQTVDLPHNWEDYHSYGGEAHGNLHGTAWYRRKLSLKAPTPDRIYPTLLFEGVGSYADVWLEGQHLGGHAGGKTAFWLSPRIQLAGKASANLLVRAHHPEKARDLPHGCGGCWGAPNTEGNQPFGLHRMVHLEWSGPVRILPFGLYVFVEDWNTAKPCLTTWVEVSNLSPCSHEVNVMLRLREPCSRRIVRESELNAHVPALTSFLRLETGWGSVKGLKLWSPENPFCYEVEAEVIETDGTRSHSARSPFGIRELRWPRIVDPNADRNVRCQPQGMELAHHGRDVLSAENNGFTEILHHEADAPLRLASRGVHIYTEKRLNESWVCRIEIILDRKKENAVPFRIEGEILNESGTVFLQQFVLEGCSREPQTRVTYLSEPILFPQEWKEWEPYLHKVVLDLLDDTGKVLERSSTTFGFMDTKEPANTGIPSLRTCDAAPESSTDQVRSLPSREKVFRINGEPFFFNGGAEYETLLGADHSFSGEQIDARVAQILAAGFNAFRDAHHPHNLRYYWHWDNKGVPCWTQFGTRLYFDSAAFRKNFKSGLIEWVRERRSHPSIIAWGIQNESALPEDFTETCCQWIQEWDPTARVERLCLTCNGGKGSDWNVPQEWSGTYGGNCQDYDLESLQMVGEYGAWRQFAQHRDSVYRGDENDRSESWACHAMGKKIELAEQSRNRAAGHWHWILNSFPNPGRSPHVTEGPGNAAFGPVNNKGLLTAWGEPSDLFYLFRAAYACPVKEPMVYIVSPTWHDRFQGPVSNARLQVFSNCEEVELFNGYRTRSLGLRHQPGKGKPFLWSEVPVKTNLLFAEARVKGSVVASHYIRFRSLPEDEGWTQITPDDGRLLDLPEACTKVLHAVNCGADSSWTDPAGTCWLNEEIASRNGLAFTSWAMDFPKLHPDCGSIGHLHVPVTGGPDCLFSAYRYGRHRLTYTFAVEVPEVTVELFFTEPSYGVGGGMDASGWRLFDVAINDDKLLEQFDLWKESGNRPLVALKKTFRIQAHQGQVRITFPRTAAGQAVIFAIRLAC